ncbi:MAG: sugar phosphate isomerase/epimerase [Terracidiphilus sp.]|jgi:sugar phosphate isomerase/epimerase
MKDAFSRRRFFQAGALIASVCAASNQVFSVAQSSAPSDKASPIHLGMASYTFRNFSRAQLLTFLKQLNVTALNVKDVKDHLPTDPREEAIAVEDYAEAGIGLHAAGVIYFPKDEDADIRSKFEYCKQAGISLMVVGDPTLEILSHFEKFVKEYDIRIAIHNHGPEDKVWPSPLDVLKAVQHLDPRMGCCIDVGHAARAGTDVVQAIYEVGPRLFNVHMKDLKDFRSKESQVAVGDGIMPVRAIFEALIATKYRGFVDLEYEVHGDDPMPGVIGSLAYMRGVLAGMGYANHD